MSPRPPALLTALALLATVLPAAGQEDAAERIRFSKGKSAAEIHGTLTALQGEREGEVETDAYLLQASAGQTITVRFTSPDPQAAYTVACPGHGLTGAGASPWTFELPESGDYRITVSGPWDATKSIPYTLQVGVDGKPHPVAPQGLTGTYGLVEDPDSTIEIRQLPDGRLHFYLLALWKGMNYEKYGPNMGEAEGTVKLEKNHAVYREEECVLDMTFRNGTVEIDQKDSNCGFGHNVEASGTYKRISLCAPPREET
jgi:hypothetical protein